MKAIISITAGAARIYTSDTGTIPDQVEPNDAPHTQEVEGDWSVGSASGASRGRLAPGEFSVEAIEAGDLRHFQLALDEVTMGVIASSESVPVHIAEGETKSFATHDSNAYTVSTTPAVRVRRTP